jgi:hypothetical protein
VLVVSREELFKNPGFFKPIKNTAMKKDNTTPQQDTKEVLQDKHTQDEYRIILWEHNVYYRASKNSSWTHTVGNKRVYDKDLIEELNDAENKKYSVPNNYQSLVDALGDLNSSLAACISVLNGDIDDKQMVSNLKSNCLATIKKHSAIIETALNNSK